ncbi:MAG: hypothetical protein KDJ19_02085 [Hyphomicrobiaceae bacterium]|nr:hypothetical protein [Hyphomicrobiaceae bacterium]MCC0025277.1 hypothetical protein [Hyphomicrobiaceae bacterium]
MDFLPGLATRLKRKATAPSEKDVPVAGLVVSDYRRHLPQEEAPKPPVARKDWGNRVAPLFGTCPYMPKKKKR